MDPHRIALRWDAASNSWSRPLGRVMNSRCLGMMLQCPEKLNWRSPRSLRQAGVKITMEWRNTRRVKEVGDNTPTESLAACNTRSVETPRCPLRVQRGWPWRSEVQVYCSAVQHSESATAKPLLRFLMIGGQEEYRMRPSSYSYCLALTKFAPPTRIKPVIIEIRAHNDKTIGPPDLSPPA